jgi:transposase-like protein
MPSTTRYPDALRQQAIALYLQGKGYKTIGHELGLSRDTVRNWIASYRATGRTESVKTTGQLRNGPSYRKREERFAAAREEYETTSASMLAVAQKHRLNYNNFRNFLLQHHPESALLHAYAKRTGELQEQLARQMEDLQKTGSQLLQQMHEELESQLARLQ